MRARATGQGVHIECAQTEIILGVLATTIAWRWVLPSLSCDRRRCWASARAKSAHVLNLSTDEINALFAAGALEEVVAPIATVPV